MKNNLFTLILICLTAISTNGLAQQSATSKASMEVTLAAKSADQTKRYTQSNAATRQSKKEVEVVAAPKSSGIEQQLATFVFVINRGEVFSVNAPGELTEVSLSGFTTDAMSMRCKGTMNENLSQNTVTLSGAVKINDYSPEPATAVTASLCLRPLTAPRGLMLGLNVDRQPRQVLLPFDSGDCRWRAGYTYRYVVTVSGGALQVTGMTVSRTSQGQE